MKVKFLLLGMVLSSLNLLGQDQHKEYFKITLLGNEIVADGHDFLNPDKLSYSLYDNMPRAWSGQESNQFLIMRTAANDTLLVNVDIAFQDSSSIVLAAGDFPLGENYKGSNSSTNCPAPENLWGPYVHVMLSTKDQSSTKAYSSGHYNFHKDIGNLVIENFSADAQGKGCIAGHFEGTVSMETTTIDSHADENAICEAANYSYDSMPIKGSFRLKLKP